MSKLGELASLIRSKNAGPFELTFDVMFADQATFDRVRRCGVLSRESVAKLYRLSANEVRFFACPSALAFKASIPRPFVQGDPGDSDGHGGQQYAPLVELEIP